MIVTVGSSSYSYIYEAVKSSEVVKIAEYDVYLDSDFVLQTHIEIDSPTYGVLQFPTKPEQGGFSDCVLM